MKQKINKILYLTFSLVGASSIISSLVSLTSCSSLNRQLEVNGNFDSQFIYGDLDKTVITGISPLANNLENFVIPPHIKSFSPNTFSNNTNVKSIDFSQNSLISSIPANAFINCYNLETIYLPNNITEIGSNAFSGLANLKWINWPKKITTQQMINATKDISVYIPLDKNNDEILTWEDTLDDYKSQNILLIPDLFIQIGDTNEASATPILQETRSITGISFQGNVTKLDTLATKCFSNFINLKKIILPASITKIHDLALYSCNWLLKIESENNFANLVYLGNNVFGNNNYIETLDLSKCLKLTNLGTTSKNFYTLASNMSNLKYIYLPNTITSIQPFDNNFISNLESLEFINLPTNLNIETKTIAYYMLNWNIPGRIIFFTYVNEQLKKQNVDYLTRSVIKQFFTNLDAIKSIWIDNSFNSISKQNVSSTSQDSGISKIGNEWANLRNVFFENNSVQNLDLHSYSFSNLTNLNYIQLPSSLRTIFNQAFYKCNIDTILIPITSTIKENAFYNSNIRKVIFFETNFGNLNLETLNKRMFYKSGINSYLQIENCPDGLFLEQSTSGTNWIYFDDGYINPDYPQFYFTNENYTSVCGLTPLGKQSENLVFPSTVKFIRPGLLQDNFIIKTIDLSLCNSLTSIPENFANNSISLIEVIGNPNINIIGNNAFLNTTINTREQLINFNSTVDFSNSGINFSKVGELWKKENY